MKNAGFTLEVTVSQSPNEVYDAINRVSEWWSEEITGSTDKLNEAFKYYYKDVHNCTLKIVELVPGKRVAWQVLDNYFSFTKDKQEWTGTTIVFDISVKNNKTIIRFTHEGLVPEYECYNACVGGWTQYVQQSLYCLVTTGKGQPNSKETAFTIHEVVARFMQLAREEKWFEIQEELFADNVKSSDPAGSPYFGYAEGKAAVRKKGQDWVKKVEAAHALYTSEPVVAGHHFAVQRSIDISVQGFGRVKLDELMLYEVKNGRIISEQFFY